MNSTIVAYAVAAEPFEYSPSFEFAGQCETVRIPAGRYPVRVSQFYGRPYFSICLEGVSTYRGWFGTNTRIDTTPQPFAGSESIRGYELAYAVLDGTVRGSLRFEMVDGYEARRVQFTSYDGTARETAAVFAPSGAELQ